MPMSRDYSMLKVNSKAFNIALANAELEPKGLAEKAGVSNNVIYTARRGLYVKPIYLGRISHALGIAVTEIIE